MTLKPATTAAAPAGARAPQCQATGPAGPDQQQASPRELHVVFVATGHCQLRQPCMHRPGHAVHDVHHGMPLEILMVCLHSSTCQDLQDTWSSSTNGCCSLLSSRQAPPTPPLPKWNRLQPRPHPSSARRAARARAGVLRRRRLGTRDDHSHSTNQAHSMNWLSKEEILMVCLHSSVF
eukprot:COSAG06_NODE_15475_length_1068_cov_2.335397_1_plen_178_part_00